MVATTAIIVVNRVRTNDPRVAIRSATRAPNGSAPETTAPTRERPDLNVAKRGAEAVRFENAKPGSSDWPIAPALNNGAVTGWADRTSAVTGDQVKLYVSTGDPTFHVEAFRMGYYQGLGGRLVERTPEIPGGLQAKPTVDPKTNMVETQWAPTTTVTIGPDWTPGPYLLKLVSASGQHYIPLTVRNDASRAAIAIIQAVSNWQAYNDWGGYSLYKGPKGGSQRAKVVSYDRPYGDDGAGDFLAIEFPLISFAEELGFDVTYLTSIDLEARPDALKNHRVIISPGHDEYWSKTMRAGAEQARDAGVNLAFLGSNAVYRRIRLEPSPIGPFRREVNYRTTSGDPAVKADPTDATTSWREGPAANPENSLVGNFYECNPVNDDGVVSDASSWVFEGTNLSNGDHISLLVGTEYDRVQPGVKGTPENIQVLMHSPLRCGGKSSFADVSYYTAPSGAGVFASGTNAWICKLRSGCPADPPGQRDDRIRRITENVLRVFAAGPAGVTHPSRPNYSELAPPAASKRTRR